MAKFHLFEATGLKSVSMKHTVELTQRHKRNMSQYIVTNGNRKKTIGYFILHFYISLMPNSKVMTGWYWIQIVQRLCIDFITNEKVIGIPLLVGVV